jgi:acetylornithine aminotransferase/acetylornithine/N-succinyldiaminopimelate aminotransferase
VVTVAKPLAAGLPLGAILTTNRVATGIHPGMHGTTFGGGPLACAVAIEFLRVTEKLLPHVRQVGAYFRAQLEFLKNRHSCVREVRGKGLMLGMELDSADAAKLVVTQLMNRHVLINRTNETVLRFLPPYIIAKKDVDKVVQELDSALQSVGSAQVPSKKSEKSTIGSKA